LRAKSVRLQLFILSGLLFLLIIQADSRRLSSRFEILGDDLNGGGARRESQSYCIRDTAIAAQPVGAIYSDSFVNRSGLAYILANQRPGDLNEDGELNHRDLFLFSLGWKSQPDDGRYRSSADLIQGAKERRIDQADLLKLMGLIGRW